MNRRDQCALNYRLSKATLLAMLRSQNVIQAGDFVNYTDRNNIVQTYRVTKISGNDVSLDANGTVLVVDKSKVSNRETPSILETLESSEWSIFSFDPQTRIACVAIDNGKNKSYLSIVVPAL